MSFRVMSGSFASGDLIPLANSADGENSSPIMLWEGVPKGTKSLALIMFDESSSSDRSCHWLVYDIPVSEPLLSGHLPMKEELEDGIKQGVNDFGEVGYHGPSTPYGEMHSFVFRLYALGRAPGFEPGLRCDELINRIEHDKILGIAECGGQYSSIESWAA